MSVEGSRSFEIAEEAAASASVSSTVKKRSEGPQWGPTALILCAICGMGLMLRTQHLSTISFWFDEACSWRMSQFPLSEMMDAISRDAHPPLFYFLMRSWMGLWGNGVLAARSVGVLFGLATIVATWWFVHTAVKSVPGDSTLTANHLDRQVTPLLAALFVSLGTVQVELSHEARPYTLATFLAVISGTFLLRASRTPNQWREWIAFSLSAAALSMTHYYGLFTVAGLFLFLLLEGVSRFWKLGWSSEVKRLLGGLALSAWLIQLIWLPWTSTFLFQLARANDQFWLGPLDWNSFASTCWKVLAGGKSSAVWYEWTWLAVAVWGVVGALLFTCHGSMGRLAACGSLVALAASAAYSLLVCNIFEVRYLILAEVYLLIGCAVLLGTGRFKPVRWLGVFGVIAWLSFWTWQFSEDRVFLASLPGTRGAVAHLNKHRDRGEPVVVSSPFVYTIALQYIDSPTGVLTQYGGDHRSNVLSGPGLRDSDYAGISDMLSSQPETLWTIDADGLFGGSRAFRVPEAYVLADQARFSERFGHRTDLIVREYHLKEAPRTANLAKVANRKR